MQIGTRRVFRLSLTTALALLVAYSMALNFPFLAPLFGFLLTAKPGKALGLKGLVGLTLAVAVMLGVGLLLIPIVEHYAFTGLVLVLCGLYAANYISLNLGKGPVGALLVVGVAMITMIGQVAFALAVALIAELMIAIAIALGCQFVAYLLFPEDGPLPEPPRPEPEQSRWLAARATLIVFPAFLLGLTNPTAYMPIIMKSVALGQQAEATQLKRAGVELLGSTLLAGLAALLFWFCLKLAPTLWMFFLWTLLFSVVIVACMYGLFPTRYTPTFWQNVLVTLLILIGPAVADSANGKDPYAASAVRLGLFIAVTIYAWMALVFLDWLKERSLERRVAAAAAMETS